MDPRSPTRRVERFLIFRLAAIPLAFALVAICQASLAPALRQPAFRLLYSVLGLYTVVAVGALAFLPRVRESRKFAALQVTIDFVVVAFLIGFTGGVGSVFCPLLFAMLFNASTVLHGGGVWGFAALSTAFLALTSLGYRLWRPAFAPAWGSPAQEDPALAASHLLAIGLALHAMAFLGTRLARRLRSVQSIQEEIIENMAEGLVALDGQGRILELNGEARRLFGLSLDQPCVGRTPEQVFPGEALRPLREAFEAEERKRFEFSLERPEGGPLPVEARISRLSEEGGRLRCRIGLFGDLRLKKEIQRAEERIHKLEELYDMALSIAHEIRNPLASIKGCAQEIGRSSKDNPQESKLVEIICRESGRLDRIIEDFMTNARRGPPDLRPVDLVEVLEETVVQLQNHPSAGRRRFVLEQPARPAWISGDTSRLKQLFLNLGINALEATDAELGEIRFRFLDREFLPMNRRRAGERRMVPGVEVEVWDNGSGLPPGSEMLVFTPFFTTKEKGSGLGLAVVHRIVHDHLGAVDVESKPGQGTRFKVWFPRCREPLPPTALAPRAPEMVHA